MSGNTTNRDLGLNSRYVGLFGQRIGFDKISKYKFLPSAKLLPICTPIKCLESSICSIRCESLGLSGCVFECDASSGGIVDVWIISVPERIARMKNVSLCEVHRDIRIRVCRLVVFQHQSRIIGLDLMILLKYGRRDRPSGRWRECMFPDFF